MPFIGNKPAQVPLTSADIADSIITSAKIVDGTIATADLNTGLTINLGAGSAGTPTLTTSGDTNTGIFFPAADTIAFSEGGTEAMRINSSGNVQFAAVISLGGATPTTSGSGITFPASQAASTDANTLDDYEEGTWTPAFTSLTINSGTPAFAGAYTKIGRIVNLTWEISGTKNITITADSTRINNLPIASNNTPAVGLFTKASTLNLIGGTVTSGTSNAYSLTTLTTAEDIKGNMVYIA
jgi:hypothetical protein